MVHPSHKVLTIILVLLTIVNFSHNAAISAPGQNKSKANEVKGLYSTDDDVEILTVENFKKEIYNSKRVWFVEFYNSWCGFCQRFAPSWKALATDVQDWSDKIAIAALDCSNDNNYPICRDFEIMAYPTLKYFHENYQEDPKNLGLKVAAGSDVNEHRQKLLETVILEQLDDRGTFLPNLLPYSDSDISNIFESVPTTAQYVFLVIQEPESFLGQEITLDLHRVINFVVRYAHSNNTDLTKALKVEKVPSLIAIKRENKETRILPNVVESRDGFKSSIKQFLKPENIDIPLSSKEKDIFTGKWVDAEVPDMTKFIQERERQALTDRIKKMGDVVFQVDLETALRYSLKHEISSVKTITGEQLNALRAYLDVLVKYFPFGKYGQSFLVELKEAVSGVSSVEGSVIGNLIQGAEKEDRQVFSSPSQWLGCKGSSPTYRGYPCGLWKMFHYLTINAADHNKGLLDPNPLEVLQAMHGYIKNFFGCSDCSRHFQEMAKKRQVNNVTSLDASILWLWQAHNVVNKRLSGDPTEDPEYPKYQFPSKENCPQCYNSRDNTWDYPETLKYLKHMYSSINIRYIGSDTRILHMGLDGSSIANGSSSVFQTIDKTRIPKEDVRTRPLGKGLKV